MATKRKDSTGHVLHTGESQRKNDFRYQYDYTDFSGKRRRIYADTLPELREMEKKVNHDLQDQIDFKKGNLTLNELFEIYMDNKTNLRDTTRANYLGLWNYAVKDSMIGNMPISKIKQVHIRAFYVDLAKKGLSEGTINLYQTMILPTLQLAVNSDWIRKNPADGANKGVGAKKQKREALTRDEQAALMGFLQEDDNIYSCYDPMISFMLATALRVGETAGLRWKNIDFKNDIIHIRQQLVYKNVGDG